jgi:quercetin dioxygenase-like cupin family protein
MELSERYIAQLEKDGFSHIYEWQDEAGTAYPEHSHRGRVTICLTDGSITITLAGKTHELVAPTVFEVPTGVPHSAIVGSRGAIYIVGEEFEGDS